MPAATRNLELQTTLLDNGGNPVTGANVSFEYKLSSATTLTAAGTGTTDATGKASVIVPGLAVPNSYDATASFAGDANYDASSGTVTGFQLKSGTTMALVLIPQ